ncbi:unnamed protein product [Psylliodes chrysocephalus]|uniref:Ig-like domain-containing protein n=1 Tax=Psylliodes chrysocephalus TaxID=3402493 RepID=A0A9P0D6C8_9CUCU|nr:unnamed protein product [Psylliodes chrysocephala]
MVRRQLFFVLISIIQALNSIKCIQINFIKVPLAVKNDSNVSVIMDCNYSLRPDDTELVIKWYLNEELVYQWIPPQSPQSFGLLKDKIDLEYKASDDPKCVHRAMKIFNPTNDIAGEYKCFVSTFTDEDFFIKHMHVFVPEKSLEVFKSGHDDQTVNFTCMASETYPKANLLLFKSYKDHYHKKRLSLVHWDVNKHTSGRFSTFIVASVNREHLPAGTIITCEMRIPDTGYVKIGSLLYYPEVPLKDSGNAPAFLNALPLYFCLKIFLFIM